MIQSEEQREKQIVRKWIETREPIEQYQTSNIHVRGISEKEKREQVRQKNIWINNDGNFSKWSKKKKVLQSHKTL